MICVTARDEVPDRVKGLRGGAEDYIVKPFAMEELLARVQVVLRRFNKKQNAFRIRDVEVQCERPEGRDGALIIHVSYTIRSTNNRYNHVYPFYMTEGSEGGGAE